MQFEWDPAKAATNVHKHGVPFADAVAVFEDDLALTLPDPFVDEERFLILGMDALGRLIVVVFTWRGPERIRLISARPATRHERRQYEGGAR